MKCRFAGSPQQGGWHRHREPLLKDSCQSVCISGAALDITTPPILNQRAAALFLNRRGVRENTRQAASHPGHRKQRGGQIHAMQSRMTHHHQ